MDESLKPDYREFIAENISLGFLFVLSVVAMPFSTQFDMWFVSLIPASMTIILAITELYRVVDYEESQTFLQKLLKVKSVTVFSTDKSDCIMCMYGIDASNDVVRIIRSRVEKCKQEKRIYEITNR